MGLTFVNFRLQTSIMQTVFHIFLMLIAQIIGVLSLYHSSRYFFPSIYANIKNITLSLIDEDPGVSLWVYFDKNVTLD